jgi:Xaa-Pro aminopeptidase
MNCGDSMVDAVAIETDSAVMAKKSAMPASNDPKTQEYRARRERVLKELEKLGAAAIVLAGEGSAEFKAHNHFVYLTGITTESGAAILFDPTAENPKRRISLILRPANPEADRWDRLREEIGTALKTRYGFDSIFRSGVTARFLTEAGRRAKKLACVMPLSTYPAAVSGDLALYKQVAERVPGVSIVDQSQMLIRMRAIKSESELASIHKAVAATTEGYAKVLRAIKPGATEKEVCRVLERAFEDAGGHGTAYGSIVGTGLNATVLHYVDLTSTLQSGELLLIDAAAACDGYSSDVTRTFPVSGKFTADQREIYELVLKSLHAAIKVARPGVRWWEVDAASRDVIESAGLGDAYMHSVGHPLGLEVHDVVPDSPLEPGMVITIEPGIYLPHRNMGVRIEDDLLITRSGSKNLTERIPKTVKDIEASMG